MRDILDQHCLTQVVKRRIKKEIFLVFSILKVSSLLLKTIRSDF